MSLNFGLTIIRCEDWNRFSRRSNYTANCRQLSVITATADITLHISVCIECCVGYKAYTNIYVYSNTPLMTVYLQLRLLHPVEWINPNLCTHTHKHTWNDFINTNLTMSTISITVYLCVNVCILMLNNSILYILYSAVSQETFILLSGHMIEVLLIYNTIRLNNPMCQHNRNSNLTK